MMYRPTLPVDQDGRREIAGVARGGGEEEVYAPQIETRAIGKGIVPRSFREHTINGNRNGRIQGSRPAMNLPTSDHLYRLKRRGMISRIGMSLTLMAAARARPARDGRSPSSR